MNTRALVEEHVAAFNAHDTARVLAGFTADAEWITGADRFAGQEELAGVFDPWLWGLRPNLEILAIVADEASAAAQLHETITYYGEPRGFDIAVFLEFEDGLIRRGKVYREGVADVGDSEG